MRGDYLFYEEKIETTPEEKEAKMSIDDYRDLAKSLTGIGWDGKHKIVFA